MFQSIRDFKIPDVLRINFVSRYEETFKLLLNKNIYTKTTKITITKTAIWKSRC